MTVTEYKQEDTRKVLTEMRTASRRTSNPSIANALNRACDRLAAMESLIFRLSDANSELLRDNELMNQQLERLEREIADARTRSKDKLDYNELVRGFFESGKPFQKILLERHRSGAGSAQWYIPKINGVRNAIARLDLPIEVLQRTSYKDDSVVPTMILYRTDDTDEWRSTK